MRFSDRFDIWQYLVPEFTDVPPQRGSWFFVPSVPRPAELGLIIVHRHRDAPLATFATDGTTASDVARFCTEFLPPGRPLDRPRLYVRGTVRHPGSPPLEFGTWHHAILLPSLTDIGARIGRWRDLAANGDADAASAVPAADDSGPVMHRISFALTERTLPGAVAGRDVIRLGIVATIEGDTDVGIRETLVAPFGLLMAVRSCSPSVALFTATCGLPTCGGFSPVRISANGNLATWRWQHGPWWRRAVFELEALRWACDAVFRAHREKVEALRMMGVPFEVVPRMR